VIWILLAIGGVGLLVLELAAAADRAELRRVQLPGPLPVIGRDELVPQKKSPSASK
jgi:hypothetical protein